MGQPEPRPRPTRAQRSGLRSLASPHEAQGALAAGTLVADRYRVVDRLGEGGMGQVYVADQLGMERQVALKVVRPALAANEQVLERFRREARAASRIKSRHVVTVYDFGSDPRTGQLFLAMELLDGEPLSARLERAGALRISDATQIASEICEALDAAHRAGVIHRDLKPENVFIEASGSAKVLDFGIARLLDPDGEAVTSHATISATIVGTPAYISPEAAARRKDRPIGAASDLYSLGVMLFEMLTGRLPFDDPEPMILLGLHLRAPPERVSDVAPSAHIPPELDELVDQLLAKRPEARPESARHVADRLRRIDAARADRTAAAGGAVTSDAVSTARSDARPLDIPTGVGVSLASGPPGDSTPTEVAPAPSPLAIAETPPGHREPEGRSDRSPRWLAPLVLVVAVVGVGALVAAGAVATLWPSATPAASDRGGPQAQAGSRSVVEPTSVNEVTAPVVAAAPATVRVTFELRPPRARVEVDGEVLEGSVLELPADGREHTAVAIEGRDRSPTMRFVADSDRTVTLVVRRSRSSDRVRSARTGPAPTQGARPRSGLLGLIRDEE